MMKVLSIATWLMLLILAGCGDASPSAEEPSAQERTITLNLDITTRADDGTDTPEKLRLWICDGSDNLIQYIENSPTWQASSKEGIDWITSLQAKIKTKEIESLNFYLVLNDAYSSVDDTSPISFNIYDIAALKNTPFVLTNYGGDNKVPMTGTKNLALNADELEYGVSINATRCVAKLGIYCTKRTSSSKLIIYSFTLNKVPDKGYLFTPVDNDINYTENRDLLSGNSGGVTIATSYTTELPTDIESVESSFTKIDFDNPYLLENTYGDEQFVTEIVNPGTRYNLTVKYNFNGSDYEQTIYLPKIERNTWYKLYMRMKEIELDTYCQVNSWTEHTMDVPPFE
ncbi:hypothetical protein [Bacteroides sp. CAG:633]|uniref:hypothetical protein n=1 Tax=Bacteroides sp. CAG:633 TaxID=1262744 RepID=UPI002587EE19|nr:hypothetical protein [Bacteroides sp. CAG:633]